MPQAYHEYDYPPSSVRHLSAERLPPVSCNPMGSGSQSTIPNSSSSHSGPMSQLGVRRQSWTDLVAASEASSVSDLSLAGASFNQSFGPLPHGDPAHALQPLPQQGAMGPRRASWLNLMDSDENIHSHKVERLPNVYHKPAGRAMTNLHKANPANRPEEPGDRFRMISASNVHLENERNGQRESGNGSPEDLVYVSGGSAFAPPLPRKNFGGEMPLVDAPYHRTPQPVYRCPCGPKKFLAVLLGASASLIVAVTAALVLRHFVAWPLIYRLEYRGRPGERTLVMADVVVGSRPELRVLGDFPFQDVRTVIDFHRGKVVWVDEIIPDYCFIGALNSTALPSAEAFRTGLHTTFRSGTPEEAVLWPTEWRLVIQELHPQLKDEFRKEFPACGDATNILALKDSFRDNRGSRCPACSEICLPDFAVDSADPEKAAFRIRAAQCVWVHVPEWARYADREGLALGGRDVLGARGPNPDPRGTTARPTVPWVQFPSSTSRSVG